MLGNCYVPGVIPLQGTWGDRILTLHLNYVAGYTSPLLFLFERTHNYYVDNQGLVSWHLRRVGRSKMCAYKKPKQDQKPKKEKFKAQKDFGANSKSAWEG